MTLQLRPDLVLVKLAPVMPSASGLMLAPSMVQPVCVGKAVQVGARVSDVQVGDVITFESSAGEPLEGLFPTPHLLIAERHITAVIEPKASLS